MTEPTRLQQGDTAPAFSLNNDKGETVSLADFAGQRVIVYFYPKANTPGCTTEACDFSDNMDQFKDASVAVLGISPDPVEKLAKFRDDHTAKQKPFIPPTTSPTELTTYIGTPPLNMLALPNYLACELPPPEAATSC
ncbi:redoxin domain-containing protein [Corynebacterium coyleae]